MNSIPRNQVEVRVTRPSKYPAGTPLSAQEGHYIRGRSQADAETKAHEKFPGERLTFTLWKQWDSEGRRVD